MKKILALDLSTKTGWSLFEGDHLLKYGLIKSDIKVNEEHPNYPLNYLTMAKLLVRKINEVIVDNNPDFIVIEETNSGRNRFSQKQLEFIHFALHDLIWSSKVFYMDTSEWRSLLGISLSKDDRKNNKEISNIRAEKYLETYNDFYSVNKLKLDLNLSQAKNKREKNKANKDYDRYIHSLTKQVMKSFRVKKEDKMVSKINPKTLSVNYVNAKFDLKFKMKDNDIADSICIGLAFIIKHKEIINARES